MRDAEASGRAKCLIADCTNAAYSRGYCSMCYQREIRSGRLVSKPRAKQEKPKAQWKQDAIDLLGDENRVIGLLRSAAAKVRRVHGLRGLEHADLVSEGFPALIRAANCWKGGGSFFSYAYESALRKMTLAVWDTEWPGVEVRRGRRKWAEFCGKTVGELPSMYGMSPMSWSRVAATGTHERRVEAKDLTQAVLRRLSRRDRSIVAARLWKGESAASVGARYGLTNWAVYAVEAKARNIAKELAS